LLPYHHQQTNNLNLGYYMNRIIITTIAGLFIAASASAQNLIGYWDQNSNQLPDETFGFAPASFPQPADQGSGTMTLSNFDTTTGGNGAYSFIQSFAGSTVNALDSVPSGGSLSPQGGADLGGNFSNNGMHIDFNVSTAGFSGISISWAQRGTSTGFDSRTLSWSANGGGTFSVFATDSGTLGSSFAGVAYDLASITALDNNPNVVLRITLDGATSGTGNNRFDNILVTAAVPEPSVYAALIGLAALGFVIARRRRAS
jgi:hypothetical protein